MSKYRYHVYAEDGFESAHRSRVHETEATRYACKSLEIATDAAVDVNQDWPGGATWCLFADGSALKFQGPIVRIVTGDQYRARVQEMRAS